MSQQIIDTSTETDTLAAGLAKANSNFTELYQSLCPVGSVLDYIGLNAPSGWLVLNGGTIGNSSSGATSLASSSAESLYVLLWDSMFNAEAPVSGGRGASAAADFAANKTITLPDARGRTTVGSGGGSFTTMGDTLGSETHVLTEPELPLVDGHAHDIGQTVSVASGGDYSVLDPDGSSFSQTVSAGNFGNNEAHNNIQPSLVLNKIIKY